MEDSPLCGLGWSRADILPTSQFLRSEHPELERPPPSNHPWGGSQALLPKKGIQLQSQGKTLC